MLLNILLVILVLDCVALTGVILMQRSEGGALGMGGGPSGMFTARGAGDLLTRMTSILTTVFFVLSLGITLLAGHSRENASITQRMKVNPIDLSALATGSSAPAPAASSAPAAPPLPTAAPPLPTAAPPLPTTAPLPSLGLQATPTLRPAPTPPAPRVRRAAPAATPAASPPAPTTTAVAPPPAPTTTAPAAPATPPPAGQ
ncbi:MAG TPA: preprotein translocase subunit SecG [Caulobacteraceae bacterium]